MENSGCLMIKFNEPSWKKWVNDFINPEDIYNNESNDFGYEQNPHVTVLYGFHDKEINKDLLKTSLPTLSDLTIAVKNISHFECDDYDVVKLEVDCPELIELHNKLETNFPNTQTYSKYIPHVTVAYVVKGKGKYYDTISDIIAYMSSDCYAYSTNDYKEEFKK